MKRMGASTAPAMRTAEQHRGSQEIACDFHSYHSEHSPTKKIKNSRMKESTQHAEAYRRKETARDHLKKAIAIAGIVEVCFLMLCLVFLISHKVTGTEIGIHLMVVGISIATVFTSLSLYRTDIGVRRFFHLLLMSQVFSLLAMLLGSLFFGKGVISALSSLFHSFPWFLIYLCIASAIPCLIATIVICYWNKKLLKGIFVTLFVFSVLLTANVSPTLGQQVPFNQLIWKNPPVRKIRFYMSESLVKKLKQERPNITEVQSMLGKSDFGNQTTELTYVLKNSGFIGINVDVLFIQFDKQGEFVDAGVCNWD
ncbi:MAG: hypothetical protein IJ610_11700 [Bacteroidaceae bacterium]|nr:hypothetical protein [Bacteroidaceae bacterium]